VGGRLTYYENSGFVDAIANGGNNTTTGTNNKFESDGSLFRAAVTASLETSFKVSKAFEGVQSRTWGLDGLRHVIQPYANLSFVGTNQTPNEILQFDRLNNSTQLSPIDFPQFNAIDALDNWSILRLGMHNRLQTRRDNDTISWFDLETYFDINFDRPDFGGYYPLSDTGTFSNLFNRLRWNPLPWVGFQLDCQLPLMDTGFTEVNSSLNLMVTRDASISLGQRYIDGNSQFTNSNLVVIGGYYRVNDNWAVSFRDQYEFADSTLETQLYQVHRDLSSWVGALGLRVRDKRGVNDIGVVLTFKIKYKPKKKEPVKF
jgi:LPS-assembly protein